MYFSIENGAKMGAGRLGYEKHKLWGQNDVILAIITSFFQFKTLIKMASFWPYSHLSKTTPFG